MFGMARCILTDEFIGDALMRGCVGLLLPPPATTDYLVISYSTTGLSIEYHKCFPLVSLFILQVSVATPSPPLPPCHPSDKRRVLLRISVYGSRELLVGTAAVGVGVDGCICCIICMVCVILGGIVQLGVLRLPVEASINHVVSVFSILPAVTLFFLRGGGGVGCACVFIVDA